MKAGIKTTEFWLTTVVSIAGAIASISNPEVFGKWGILISAIATGIYSAIRLVLKKTVVTVQRP